MKTAIHDFGAAGRKEVTELAPSGGMYVIKGLTCSNGQVVARTYPSSGFIMSTVAGNPITNITARPSGDYGWNESIELQSTAACLATVSYIMVAPYDRPDRKGYIPPLERDNIVSGILRWEAPVLSGSYRSEYGSMD